MESKGPIFIKTAAICLILLIIVSAGWSLVTGFGLVRGLGNNFVVSGPGGNFTGRGFSGSDGNFQRPEGFQPGDGNFQPPDGGFQGQPGGQLPEGAPQGQQNFSGDLRPGASILGPLGLLRWLGVGVSIAALIGGVLAIIGLFKGKKWGVVLSILLAALLGLTSAIGFIRFTINLTTGIAMLKILLATAVIVLLLLPASRKTLTPASASVMGSDDEEELSFRTIR